jgi:4-oxalocrotonate tautomerase
VPLIHVQMAEGRSDEQKQALLHAISEAAQRSIDAPPETVRVWITEFSATEFLVGDETLAERRARTGT